MTVRNLEWLNLNCERNFPLLDGAVRKDNNNVVVFPNSIILDAVFVMNNVDTRLFIKTIKADANVMMMQVYDNNSVHVGNFFIDCNAHKEYNTYYLNTVGEYKFCQGKIVIGDLSQILLYFVGVFEFNITTMEFEKSTIIPSLKGVNSISILNNSELFTGIVKLKSGYNMRIRYDSNDNAIYFDAIDGHGTIDECESDIDDTNYCIRTINSIPPDKDGNFNIRALQCLSLSDGSNSIIITNECEGVCCDCEDSEALEALLKDKQDQIDDLEARVLALEN